MTQDFETVYILTNKAMPGLIKIGKTEQAIERRLLGLYSTGVPVPFECYYAAEVSKLLSCEKRLHRAFARFRLNDNREFFEIEPNNVVEILEMVQIRDVTPRQLIAEQPEDNAAVQRLSKRAERFSFTMVNIKVGTVLNFDRNPAVTCTVAENNKVLFRDKIESLSNAALLALHQEGYTWQSCQGSQHWLYDNRTLQEIREEMENQ